MEPYLSPDSILGWVGNLYLGVPVFSLLVLFVLLAVGAPHVSTAYKKLVLYPILKIVRKGAGKSIFIKGGVS